MTMDNEILTTPALIARAAARHGAREQRGAAEEGARGARHPQDVAQQLGIVAQVWARHDYLSHLWRVPVRRGEEHAQPERVRVVVGDGHRSCRALAV